MSRREYVEFVVQVELFSSRKIDASLEHENVRYDKFRMLRTN